MKKIKAGFAIGILCMVFAVCNNIGGGVTAYATSQLPDSSGENAATDTQKKDTDNKEKKMLQQLKKEATSEIKDYAKIKKVKVAKEIAKQINELVNKYISLLGEADKDKNLSGLSTEASITECVTEAKDAIDALVGKENDSEQDGKEESITPSSTSEFIMVGGNWVTPVATYGQVVNVVLPVVNMGAVNLANVTVTPVTSNMVNEWPFEIETSGYTQTIRDLPGVGNGQSDMDRRRELTWTLRTRSDALSGYYKLQFNVLYYVGTEPESATLTTYVKVNGAPGSGSVEAEGGSSTPRVIVTGFDTDPKEVHAGDTFVLTLHLKNTSLRTPVSNMLVTFSAPSEGLDSDSSYAAFLPTSGSNSEYISNIGKGATIDLSIEMTAKADLSQKPYVLDVNMEFEDEDYTAYTSSADVSIPVHQDARFELSKPEVLPENIMVGNEANIMFSIYNTGKLTLYNTKVRFESDSISGGDTFLGKIEAGATGAVDAMVSGIAPTGDNSKVKVIVEYEDDTGSKSTYEEEIELTVTGEGGFIAADGMMDMEMSMDTEMDMEEFEYEEETSSKKGIIIALIVIGLLVIGVGIGFVVRHIRRKKEEAERVNLLEELEGEDDSDEIS